MSTTIMMYVIPMLLGQSYDLGKERPGLQIFPSDVEEDAVKIEHYFTDSQYRMVENAAQVKDFLDISGKLSLKIKSGMLDVSGEGHYLKDSSSKTNGMEILVKVHFETVTKTIPSFVKPKTGWTLYPRNYLGTHYCRSITYGGDLVASIRITATNNYDLLRIKGAINGGINAGGGSFEGNVKGKLEMLKQNAQDSSSMEINYYATVPIQGVSYDVDGLLKLIDEFPEHVKNVNNGTGNPLRMELFPLSSLDTNYPAFFESRALNDQLDDLETQFDDLLETRRKLQHFIASLPPVTPKSVDEKIKKFNDKVNKVYEIYAKTISDLDLSEGAPTKYIDDTFVAYKDGEYIFPQKYARHLASLQKEIYDEHPELRPRIGGADFIRWGYNECTTFETETFISGVMATSELVQEGGSSEFMCSTVDPVEINPKSYFPGYPGKDDPDEHLLVSPIRYQGELKKFSSMKDKPIACAQCRATLLTTVLVVIANNSCPTDKWTKEYEGILMAPGFYSSKGEYVCVDVNMKSPDKTIKFGNSEDSRLPEVKEVTVECGSLPCEPYEANKPIPCVVCTI